MIFWSADIFKNKLPKDAAMEDLTAKPTFNYKSNMKRRERFIEQVLPALKSRTDEAIIRAKRLEASFNSGHSFHQRNPCTMVHYIVLDILANQP